VFDQFPSIAILPASDIERAKGWYLDKLGLTPTEEDEGGLTYQTGGTRFGLYPSQFAGTNQAIAMGFEVQDLDQVADDLIAREWSSNASTFPTRRPTSAASPRSGRTEGSG
jgi:hypothetical protein